MTDTFYISMGKVFRESRERLGLTQQEVADIIGLSRPAYVNIEKGRQRILFHNAALLCALFQIDMNKFKAPGRVRIVWEAE